MEREHLGGLAGGMNYWVNALAASASDLFAGGDFTTADGSPASRGRQMGRDPWTGLGSGLNNSVRALALSGTDLYVGGLFLTAGGKVSAYARGNSCRNISGQADLLPFLQSGEFVARFDVTPGITYTVEYSDAIPPPKLAEGDKHDCAENQSGVRRGRVRVPRPRHFCPTFLSRRVPGVLRTARFPRNQRPAWCLLTLFAADTRARNQRSTFEEKWPHRSLLRRPTRRQWPDR